MKIIHKYKLLILLLSFLLCFQSPLHGIHASAKPVNERLISEYRLTILPVTKSVFVEATIKGAQKSDIKGWVAGVGGLNPTFITSAANEIKFAYTVAIPEAEKLNSPDAMIDKSHFRSWGWNVFIFPTFDKPSGETVVLINSPEGWKTATSFGVHQTRFVLPNLNELMTVALVSGDFRINSFEAAEIPVYLAVRQNHHISDAAFVETLKRLIEAGVAYTGAKPPERIMFGIDLLGDKKTNAPGNHERTNAHGSTLLIDRNDADATNPHFFGTYAHEFSHTWIPAVFGNSSVTRKELGSIFKEGFTDYLAYRITHYAGLHSDTQFANTLSKFYQEYLDVATSVKNENDAEFLKYRQGMMAALIIDIELQRATKGKIGFREFMQTLIKEHANTDGLTKQEFMEVLTRLGGERFLTLYNKLTDPKQFIDFSFHLKGTGIQIKPISITAQELKEQSNKNNLAIQFNAITDGEKKFLRRFLSYE